jgi:hypothetical protein
VGERRAVLPVEDDSLVTVPLRASHLRAVLVLALVLVVAGSSWGREPFHRLRSDHDPVAERELRHLEQVFSSAFNNRDARTLDWLLGEDFIVTDEQGSVSNKAQYIDVVVNHIRVLSGGISDLIVLTYRDSAVVVGRFDGVTIVDGREASDVFRFTDVWVHRFGRWYVIASQNSPIPH